VGSFGTLLLDAGVFVQYFLYLKDEEIDDQSAEEAIADDAPEAAVSDIIRLITFTHNFLGHFISYSHGHMVCRYAYKWVGAQRAETKTIYYVRGLNGAVRCMLLSPCFCSSLARVPFRQRVSPAGPAMYACLMDGLHSM